MKAIVCLGAFLLTLGSAFAIDNMVKGENFDGETGLKTGAQLEDLVTESYWSAGAFATNNAIRLFDASQFELGTDTTGITGTNVATIKTGGITTAEILDGTIGTNDLSIAVLDLLNSYDYSVSRDGLPRMNLVTSMWGNVAHGGTVIPPTSMGPAFDGDITTYTTNASKFQSTKGFAYYDFGEQYSGVYEIVWKYRITSALGLAANWSTWVERDLPSLLSGQPRNGSPRFSGMYWWSSATTGTNYKTNSVSRHFTGRYLTIYFANPSSQAIDYRIGEILVWATNSAYSSLGGL